jgi:hypothetical protein
MGNKEGRIEIFHHRFQRQRDPIRRQRQR